MLNLLSGNTEENYNKLTKVSFDQDLKSEVEGLKRNLNGEALTDFVKAIENFLNPPTLVSLLSSNSSKVVTEALKPSSTTRAFLSTGSSESLDPTKLPVQTDIIRPRR